MLCCFNLIIAMRLIKNETIPIKMWLDDIEPNTEKQARNIANLPGAFHHIAIMPDAHLGYGMPIGGVLATKNIIVPNAVGVDIGCFSKDTKIPLLNGTQKELKELYKNKEEFWVYSIDKNKKVVPGKAVCLKTKRNTGLMEVEISGGDKIKCTPDHKFLMRSGGYKEARDLKYKDSLMPLYRTYQTRDGYESILNPEGQAVITHKMVAEYFYGKGKKGYVVHHKNNNQFDNHPENLIILTENEHNSLHGKKNASRLSSKKFKKNRLNKLKNEGFYDKKYTKKKKDIAIKNITSYMKNNPDHFKEAVKGNGERGKQYLIAYNKSKGGRDKSKEIANRIYVCDICGKKVKSPIGLYNHKRKEHNNHKVINIKYLKEKEDVYCLNVKKYHNFALSAGIFVHNCGMTAIKTSVKKINENSLKQILNQLRRAIPTGFTHHKQAQDWNGFEKAPNIPIIQKELQSARKQIGTLGGGNHFLEILQEINDAKWQIESKDNIWLMLHSGSRNFGYKTANFFHRKAKQYCEANNIKLPDKDLAFLKLNSHDGQNYWQAMNYCLDFAHANRILMMKRFMEIFYDTVNCEFINFNKEHNPQSKTKEIHVGIHHNYAAEEEHFGKQVIVHRKGATRAFKNQLGIVPGSMGTPSFIIEGLGNPESFMSCAHGAGRAMGRREANKKLTKEQADQAIKGVIFAGWQNKFDEAPQAYKNIEQVIKNQIDLARPIVKLKPLAVMIGH